MKLISSLIVLAGFVAQAATTELSGKVFFKGKVPKKEAIRMASDPACLTSSQGTEVYRDDIVVNGQGALANVVVYLKEGTQGVAAENLKPVTLEQKGCHYEPHVLALRVNQPLKIVNRDPTMHNVHWKPEYNPETNFGQVGVAQTDTKKFTKPEVGIRIRCDVHGWMNAYVSVFDHPYFAVTDNSGSFSIKDIPPGQYTVATWHEKFKEKSIKLTLNESGGKKKIDFTY